MDSASLEAVVGVVLGLLGGYLVAGALIAPAIHLRVLPAIDASVRESGVLFRLVITPGLIALWPLLIRKYLRARSGARAHSAIEARSAPRKIRRAHGVLVVVLAIVVPIAFGLALYARAEAPAEQRSTKTAVTP